MKVITFFNNKGGVGKTTLAVNIASFLATHFEKRVLFMDADPQANSTQMLVPEDQWDLFYGKEATKTTLLNFLTPIQEGDANVDFHGSPFFARENRFKVDLIPGHPRLSMIEDILSDAWKNCVSGDIGGFRKTNWLRAVRQNYDEDYDYMFIDVGPSLGALNRSILLNSDFMVTPMGSDIFSLIGVSNISAWISNWIDKYVSGLGLLQRDAFNVDRFPLNVDLNKTARLIGYSVQQYVTRSFKEGPRPIASYDRIIQEIPDAIIEHLHYLIYPGLSMEDLNLGSVPYLYSLVPLAQSAKSPIYDLKKSDGIVGGQGASVKKFFDMLMLISHKILSNIGDINDNKS